MKGRIEKQKWADVRDYFLRLNPELALIIDKLSPSKRFPFYKICYPYGAEILKKGAFYVPNQSGEIVPITDASIHKSIRADLHYNFQSNPVCMPLKNMSEIYLSLGDMQIPFAMVKPGNLLGAWGVLDKAITPKYSYHPGAIWDMSAGARSIFMLPRVSDATFHKRLQQSLGVRAAVPKSLWDQWYVFKDIVLHSDQARPWVFELVCFSADWFKYLKDPAWRDFYNYLLSTSWGGRGYLRNQAFWDLILSVIRKENNIPVSSYIHDLVKHLLAIACGSAQGFAPLIDEQCAPVRLIQDVYVNGFYRLKDYMPVIMAPRTISAKRPVYFSMNHITALEFSEKQTKRPGLMKDLTTLFQVLNQYRAGLLDANFDLDNTAFHAAIQRTSFEFFYEGATDEPSIQSNDILPHEDASFNKILAKTDNAEFPCRAGFVRGCVRLSRRKL